MNKLTFQPVRNFGNIIPWNQRIRMLCMYVNQILDRLDALEGNTKAETVADEDSQVVTVNEAPVDEPQQIDEKSKDHPVRQKAKSKGIKSWHVKGIDTLKKEIAEKEAEA